MRMAYDGNGQLMVDNGLGWTSPSPTYLPPPADGLGGDCGCGRGVGQAAPTGTGPWLVIGALAALWAISAAIAKH